MNMVSAKNVSELFLTWAKQNGDLITNLKMQKLLYYAQAWHLVNFNRRLFDDRIEAWELGPVIPKIYGEYKKYRGNPIPYKISGNEEKPFSERQVQFLKQFFNVFSSLSSTALVNMTHNETPWKDNFGKGKNTEIPPSEMKDYYTEVFENGRRKRI